MNRDPALALELERLPPALVNFLKLAAHDCPGVLGHEKNFFFYLKQLSDPTDILSSINGQWGGRDDLAYWKQRDRYVSIYLSTSGFVMLVLSTY
jgi:hypothetical protein